ncbi:hypothetical protein [Nonomuraea longicatena]|uniref:Uncharacterized protein n=1 Tax=Nonomuraea longicatena TaxID=83682 RepID=A0ABN1Q407_9ACTN
MPDAPLLHYSTSTAPLQAGTADKPSANTIDITVSSPAGRNVYCDKIDVAVPVSAPDDGGAWFTENPQSSIAGKWNPASTEVKSGRELGLDAATNYYHVVFQPPPIPGFDLIDTPLKISITGNVAADPGSTLTCSVTETSGTASGDCTRKAPQDLTWETAEPPFYLHSFLACSPERPTVPKTKFNAGDQALLTWESNGDSFHLYDGDGTVLHEGVETSWTIPASVIANDTTFSLKASKKGATGFETADRYATVTVTVTNPTLRELTVKGQLGVYGALTANDGLSVYGGLTANDSVSVYGRLSANDGLSVSDGLTADTVEARSVTVEQYCQIDGDCNVAGDLATEAIVASGYTTLNGALTVNGGLTANGDCDVNGWFSANHDLRVSYGGTEKMTTVGKSGLSVEGDFSVSYDGTQKITTDGYNGLCVDGDLTVYGRIQN